MNANDSPGLLTGLQRKFVAGAITLVSVLVIASLVLFLIFLLQRIVSFFSGVIWPLAIAGILALLLRPLVILFESRLGLSRVKAISLLYTLVLLACLSLLAFLLPRVIQQSLNFIELLPDIVANLRFFLEREFPGLVEIAKEKLSYDAIWDYSNLIIEGIKRLAIVSLPAIRETGAWMMGVFSLAAGMAIIPIYLFFFLETDRDPTRDLREQLSFLNDNVRHDVLFLVREFASIMEAFFRGQLLIGLIMGLLLAIGFSLVGLEFGLLLGLLLGLLNIIPYLGTILGLASALPIAFFQPDGGLTTAGLTLLIFVIVQALEGYLLTPKIIGRQTGLHPFVVIVAIFFWGAALDGLLGMVLAIPLTAFFIVAWRMLRRKYLDRLRTD